MVALSERFDAKVDRSGVHHIWLGSKRADGTGKLKVDGSTVSAARVAWELANGPLPAGAEVRSCPERTDCVRADHLGLRRGVSRPKRARRRAAKGGGTRVEVRPGVWKLSVTVGRYDDGPRRRVHQTVRATGVTEAERELARFVAEVNAAPLPESSADRDVTVDVAVERYLVEYLAGEKGREAATIARYRSVHGAWFSPVIGRRRVRDVDGAAMDGVFGRMRRAGLSASRMNDAKSLYVPFFRWAKRRRIIRVSPMADFEMPTSSHVAREHVPPEVDQLCRYLAAAVEVVPDVAPVLALGAVTGMRRGELVTIRRSRLRPAENRLTVDVAYDSAGKRVKTTKNRREREVHVDPETMAMLVRHCEAMDERAALFGVEVAAEAFVFSLDVACAVPMPADHLTKQVARLKDHLGIAVKRPETAAREDEALALYRSAPGQRRAGRPGPQSKGGMSYRAIGELLGRSERWAQKAVESAQRREAAARSGDHEMFDGSVVALRKFTSSELLDAGFNISAVAHRQGHGPQVLVKHYAKPRRSADRRAAEHLGNVVHGTGGRPVAATEVP